MAQAAALLQAFQLKQLETSNNSLKN